MRLTLVSSAMLSCVLFIAAAWATEATWITDAKTGCKVWNSNPADNESITWSGGCKDGLADGQGTVQWFRGEKPGARYEGTMVDGKESGHGVYTFANGQRYEGHLRQ